MAMVDVESQIYKSNLVLDTAFIGWCGKMWDKKIIIPAT
jgi:hypothetical protein